MKDSSKQQSPEAPHDPIKEASLKHRPEARIIEEAMPAAVLATIAGASLKQAVSSAGFKAYLDKLFEDSGSQTDPIERHWIEQVAWAHFGIGNLLAKAAAADSPELVAALIVATTKLMAEHRKHGLALREYRSPVVPQQVTVVKQQNVASGNQQIAMVEGKPQVSEADSDIKQGNNQARWNHVEFNNPFAPAASRTAEPVEAQRLNVRGTRKAAANGHGEPSLEVFDGSEDNRG